MKINSKANSNHPRSKTLDSVQKIVLKDSQTSLKDAEDEQQGKSQFQKQKIAALQAQWNSMAIKNIGDENKVQGQYDHTSHSGNIGSKILNSNHENDVV